MNKAYRLVWNQRLNAWVVASELARACGKRSSGRARAGLAAVAIVLGTASPLAAADLAPGALPSGGTVAAGQAGIATSGTRMDITQGSQKAIINWQGFDIGSQAQVNFAQPNASAVALNRVSGPNISRIEGQLTANGQVFLVNPNGVLFGGGARVNAGAFVASTLNIRDDDFLTGNYSFSGSGGAIENRGTISAAPGGYVAFIAPRITNAGNVSAPQGTVAMGAGERVTLNFAGDRLVGLSVAADTLDTLIENRQAIRAEGGAILLTAAGAETITRSVINNSGVLEASSLTSDGGRIVLTAGNDITLAAGSAVAVDGQKGGEITVQAKGGTLLADGSLSAHGAEGNGGSIQLLGHQVGLVNAAQVVASGATGGGTVLVGGDYQGGNAEVQNAFRTYVGPQATIKADALQRGDGGNVVVWADDTTRYYGAISARGGAQGGNGGLVEVSGKQVLDFSGAIDVTAPLGAGGRVLLDPQNIVLNTTTQPSPPNNPNGTPDVAFGDPPAVGTMTIQIADITGFSELFLQATNDITVSNPITMAVNNGIRLEANNNITLAAGANVTTSGTGSINFRADADNSGAGTLAMNNAALRSNVGGITLSGASISGTGTINTTGAANANGGNIAITGTSTAGSINLTGAMTTTGGTAAANSVGRNAGNVTITGAGAVTTGAITANGSNGRGANRAGGNGGNVAITSSTNAVTVGAISAVGGNGGTVNANGGNAGAITLDAGGATPSITLGGNLSATGGNRVGTGTAGSGGQIWLKDAVLLNAAITASAQGGSAGAGAGANVRFDGTINSTGAARALTVNSNAATIFGGAVGGSSALTSLTTNAGGTTSIGGNITTTGVQTYNDAVTLTGNAVLTGTTPTFASTVAGGGFDLTLNFSGTTTVDGANFTGIRNLATGNGGTTQLTGAITTSGTQTYNDAVTLTGATTLASSGNGAIAFNGTVNGAQTLAVNTTGATTFAGAVGGMTALTSLTTNAGGTTLINGGSVRTTGNQTYNDNVSLGTPTMLSTTANGSISANGSVAANGNALTLNAGAGNVTMQNAANDFATVSVTSATNVALRDANAIDLGASTIGANLTASAGGTVTDSGAISVAGATTINADAANDVTLDNANDFAGNVAIQSGRNVRLNDINNLTLDLSSFSTLTATAAGTVTLAGQLTATGAGDAIVLAGSRFVNSAGATALSVPIGSRWLVWSSNLNPFGGATPDNRGGLTYDFKQYNATFGVTAVAQATGNGFLYSLAPTITPDLTGTVSKVYDATTSAPLVAANFTPTSGIDGDVIAMSGAGAYDNPNVAGSPTKLVTATGIAATVTSSIADGSKQVYGYTLTSTTASANIGEITPASLTVTGNTTSSTYTAAAQTNGFTTSGLLGSDSVTGVSGLASRTNVGTTADNLSGAIGTGLGNYTISYVNGSLTFTPAALTITANNAQRPINTTNPPFSATYAGFVGGESAANLNGTLAFSTPATVASPAGAYAITPFGQTSGNYAITYVDGVLQVTGGGVVPPQPPEPPQPPVGALPGGYSPQAVAATFTDPQFIPPPVPAVQYVEGGLEEGAETQGGSRIRVVSGGLNVGR